MEAFFLARKKQDPTIRRNEFIDTAINLFLTKGYEETSLRDILKELGGESALSPSVFYYYFKSKDELRDTCLNVYVDRYAEDLILLLKDDTFDYAEKMRKIIERITLALHHVGKMMLDDSSHNVTLIQNMIADRYFSKIIPQLAELIQDGLKSGKLPMTELAKETDPRSIAKFLCNGIATLFHDGAFLFLSAPHSFENVRLIPVYAAQILGLPVSALQKD